jgi:hypothetical protein
LERDSFPIDFLGKLNPISERVKYPSAQRVFLDATADIRSESSKEGASNMMVMSLSIIAMCGTLALIVIGAIIFFTNRGSA